MSRPWRTYTLKLPEEVAIAVERAFIAGKCSGLSNNLETIEAMAVGFYLEHQAAVEAEANDWQRLKLEILEETGFRCLWCKHSRDLELHHIIPRGYHGPDRPEDIDNRDNLAPLCRGCHTHIQPQWRGYVLLLRMKLQMARETVLRHGYMTR